MEELKPSNGDVAGYVAPQGEGDSQEDSSTTNDTVQIVTDSLAVARAGRVSAFGPNLDGGFLD